jgi:hypothetical protein
VELGTYEDEDDEVVGVYGSIVLGGSFLGRA